MWRILPIWITLFILKALPLHAYDFLSLLFANCAVCMYVYNIYACILNANEVNKMHEVSENFQRNDNRWKRVCEYSRTTISVAQFLPFFTLIWFCRWFVFCWYEFWIAMNASCSLFFTNIYRILKRIKSIKISLFANWKAPSVELKVSLKWHHFLHGKFFYNEN